MHKPRHVKAPPRLIAFIGALFSIWGCKSVSSSPNLYETPGTVRGEGVDENGSALNTPLELAPLPGADPAVPYFDREFSVFGIKLELLRKIPDNKAAYHSGRSTRHEGYFFPPNELICYWPTKDQFLNDFEPALGMYDFVKIHVSQKNNVDDGQSAQLTAHFASGPNNLIRIHCWKRTDSRDQPLTLTVGELSMAFNGTGKEPTFRLIEEPRRARIQLKWAR